MKSSTFRCATLLVACCYLVLALSVFMPLAHAVSPWIQTYDTSDNPTNVFHLGDTVRIKAYSDTTPYYIFVEDPKGVVVFTDTSNTASYSQDVTGITTTLGRWNITLVAQQRSCESNILTVDDLSMDFGYVGRDLTTQGDWIESQYGDCGYALPWATPPLTEVAVGETTGIGESAHEYWWREPWSVPGEKYYSYEDYLGGLYILEYNITGSKGPPRALVDNDTDFYRPSWYGNDSSITVTINGIAGDYNLSIYFLDWDAPGGGLHRKLKVNVTSSGDWDTATLGNTFPENFAAGTYAIFEVESDGTIEIEVTNLGFAEYYAVISGIFLDSVSGPLTGVSFVGTDRFTKGNWRSSYGSDYYLLAGFDVPASNVSYTPIDKAYDVTNIPLGSYTVSGGVCQFAADDARTYGGYPYIGQYAAYEWIDNSTAAALDTRVLIYPEDKIYYGYPPTPLDRRYYGQWDSGELNGLLNYFTMRLKIPEGPYIFSIYAVDFEQMGRSETIQIWNESMTDLLCSQHITAAEINNGIYIQWLVQGPRIINIKVIADKGNLNSFIDGIFLNCLCPLVVEQFFVIPEVPLGTIVALAGMFGSLGIYMVRRKKKQKIK